VGSRLPSFDAGFVETAAPGPPSRNASAGPP